MTVITEPELTDVHAVVEEVWSTFLGTAEPLLPCAPTGPPPAEWTAAVTITGGWEGMVLVALTDTLAREVGSAMLALPAGELETDDVQDALGELVNVIGGNIKSLMPGPSTLSLPLVARGSIGTSAHLEVRVGLDLSWAGQPMHVLVGSAPTREEEDR